MVRDPDVLGCSRPRQHCFLYVFSTHGSSALLIVLIDEMKALNQLGWMSMCDKLLYVMMPQVVLMFMALQRLRHFDE